MQNLHNQNLLSLMPENSVLRGTGVFEGVTIELADERGDYGRAAETGVGCPSGRTCVGGSVARSTPALAAVPKVSRCIRRKQRFLSKTSS